MHDKLNIKGEWFLEWRNIDGILLGSQRLNNFITTAGKNLIAQEIENLSSPYLVLGTDTTAGEVITEGFRKAVSIITRTSNLVRFRTQMLASEANGNWEKASLVIVQYAGLLCYIGGYGTEVTEGFAVFRLGQGSKRLS